jgi:hypothetical protein
MADEGPELIQIDDGLVVLVLPNVEMPHSNLHNRPWSETVLSISDHSECIFRPTNI